MLIHVISTQSFIIPICLSFYYQQYLLFCTYLMMYSGSTIYHLNDKCKKKRLVDLTTSRLGGIITFYYHISHTNNISFPIVLLHNITSLYVIFRLLHYYQNILWIHIHVYFHIVTSFTLVCVCMDIIHFF